MKFINTVAILTCAGIVTLCCNACGFHIATRHTLGEKYTNLVLIGDKHETFTIELDKQLTLNGVNVMYGENSIHYYNSIYLPVLTCSDLRSNTSTVAVGSNSQDLEHTLRSEIYCRLYTPNHKPYAIKSSINRAYVSTPGSNLATDSRDQLLVGENAVELSHEIIDRLHGSYLSIEEASRQTEDLFETDNPLEGNHVRVVFNATSGDEPTDDALVSSEKEAQAIIDARTHKDTKAEEAAGAHN